MRPRGSAKALERRRRRAVALLNRGLTIAEVAHRLGVSAASVYRWRQALAVGGPAALAAKPVPGRPRKLSEAQCGRLLKMLSKGAHAHGYSDGQWTLKRIARLIRREFGVEYHPNHVWRLLRRCGWARPVPRRQPVRHDDASTR